jgi:hypothetical protein
MGEDLDGPGRLRLCRFDGLQSADLVRPLTRWRNPGIAWLAQEIRQWIGECAFLRPDYYRTDLPHLSGRHVMSLVPGRQHTKEPSHGQPQIYHRIGAVRANLSPFLAVECPGLVSALPVRARSPLM